VKVQTVLGGGLWNAFIDRPQLESAILNLALNARDAMPDGGRLTIETANASLDSAYAESRADVVAGQYVLVAVTDTGGGMPPEVMARAFDPFYTTKPPGAGTGLGLAQVHGFLKQSHGHVAIYSEEGAGTTVKLYLPRATEGPVQAPVTASTAQRFAGGVEVLLVEDNAEVRAFAAESLEELGFVAHVAEDAEAALALLERRPETRVLLTDVVMPVTDGRRLADAAQAMRPGLKVLFMTGYTKNAIVHNGRLDEGVALLTKPFTLDDLARELRAVLGAEPSA
jgi:CheY-like chemotaxis protein